METRVQNSKRNLLSGMVLQIVNIILPFITRTAIIYVLGELYAGLSGLFGSVLQVLNLADLGFSTAVVYALYKPIAEKNWKEVNAIVAFLRKIYKIVGSIILLCGLCLLPFLMKFISGEVPKDTNIYILFFIYLANAAISYMFFAHKSALLTAMQREDVVSNISTFTSIITKTLQIIILITTRNYYLYIILMPIGTVINNILYEVESRKLFSCIVPKGKISSSTSILLKKQIKGIIFNRVGDVARNSFDNIVLSSLLGLAIVAIYNNYYLIYSSLYGITIVINRAIQASVGNSIVTESVDKNYNDFRKFTFIFTWFTGFCTICMLILFQPFMLIWMRGNEALLLKNADMLLFCVYFYAITMNNTRNLYINGNGLFWECRAWYIVEAIGNLVLNIALGYLWGVTGILLATIITIFFFNFLSRNIILFKCYFKRGKQEYYRDHLIYALSTAVASVVVILASSLVKLENFAGLIIKGILCVILINVTYWICYRKTNVYMISSSYIKNLLQRR